MTKDSNFSSGIILSSPPPRVIHIKVGNVNMKEFHEIITSCWSEVLKLSQTINW
ncbi:MAG: DUF5615 family PIN-like protein [Bacteroidota bacterium]